MNLTIEAFDAAGYEIIDDGDRQRVWSHPAFQQAVRLSISRQLGLRTDLPGMQIRNMREMVCCIFVFFLHGRPDGLSLTSLKAAVTAAEMPGAMARVVLGYMQFLRYVTPLPLGADRRQRQYAPTEEMRLAFRLMMRRELEAAALVEPDVVRLLECFDEPAVFAAFMDALGVATIRVFKRNKTEASRLEDFARRSGGMAILYELVRRADEDDETPPRRPVSFTVSGLAKVGRISRPQANLLLRNAEAAGLIERPSEQELVFTEALRAAIRSEYANLYAGYATFARRAVRVKGDAWRTQPPSASPPAV